MKRTTTTVSSIIGAMRLGEMIREEGLYTVEDIAAAVTRVRADLAAGDTGDTNLEK